MIKQVFAGNLAIGGGAPVSVQSMTNTNTRDISATLKQINALAEAGCDLVRVSVYDQECSKVFRNLVEQAPVPLSADIHFDYRLAISAVENGAQKLRINPGNIGGFRKLALVCDCAGRHHIPIRVGVNSGSLEKDLLRKYGGPTPQAMVESALRYVKMLEECHFNDIVISIKASNVQNTIEANRLIRKTCDYPLHIGVTESGMGLGGIIKSSIGIGTLLLDGIGETIRVSLSGDPVQEVDAAIEILKAIGLRSGVDVISCPTCGRTCIDVEAIAAEIKAKTKKFRQPMKVAVMGCVVNGPGEAREADLGIAGGPSGTVYFEKNHEPQKITGDICRFLLSRIDDICKEKQ